MLSADSMFATAGDSVGLVLLTLLRGFGPSDKSDSSELEASLSSPAFDFFSEAFSEDFGDVCRGDFGDASADSPESEFAFGEVLGDGLGETWGRGLESAGFPF